MDNFYNKSFSNSINFILFSYISLINLYFYSSNSGLSIDTALTSNYSYKPLNVTLKSITDVLAYTSGLNYGLYSLVVINNLNCGLNVTFLPLNSTYKPLPYLNVFFERILSNEASI